MKFLTSVLLTTALLSLSNAQELMQRDDGDEDTLSNSETTTLDATSDTKATSSVENIIKNAVSSIEDSDYSSTVIPLPTLDPETISSTSRAHRTRTFSDSEESGEETTVVETSEEETETDSIEDNSDSASDSESQSGASLATVTLSTSNNANLQFGNQYAINAGISLTAVGFILSLL